MTPLLILTRPLAESESETTPAADIGAAAPPGPDVVAVWRWPLLATQVAQRMPALQRQLQAAAGADLLIHVSVAGVRALATLAPDLGRDPAMTVAAVGPATAQVATTLLGRSVLAPPATQAHSEGLLALLAGRSWSRVAIALAPGGRELLVRALQERGAQVHELPVYQRLPITPAASELERLRQMAPQAWISVTSVAVLEVLRSVLTATGLTPAAVRLVCSAPRIAEAARLAGFTTLVVAQGADVDALRTAIHTQPQGVASTRC